MDFPKHLPTNPSLSVPTTVGLTEALSAPTGMTARAHTKLHGLSPSLPQILCGHQCLANP